MDIYAWAQRWNVPPAAVNELLAAWGAYDTPPTATAPTASEAHNQSVLRMAMAKAGGRLWRNNVGALFDERGVPVRYGLGNDSKQLNQVIKSADLIGIKPTLITPAHVGHIIGQFVSREVKAGGWRYRGTPREQAQLRWAELVISLGGDAAFSTGALY